VVDDRFTPLADTNVPGFFEDLNAVYFDMLPYRDDLLALRAGEDFTRTRDCPDEVYLTSELYNDHFRRLGLYEVLHYCLFEDEAVTAGITFSRTESMGTFGRAEREALASLVPHMQRAAGVHITVTRAAHRDRLTRETLDLIPQPMLLMTPHRKVTFHNKAALETLSRDNGLWLDAAGRLRCTKPADCQAIGHLVDSVFEIGGMHRFGGRAFVRRTGRKPLAVSITPFREATAHELGLDKLALLTISDPETSAGLTESDMRSIFGLTRTESRVARLIADGSSLTDICEKMEITPNTARTHLKRVFAKTDTNRQTELMKLLMGFPYHYRNGHKS